MHNFKKAGRQHHKTRWEFVRQYHGNWLDEPKVATKTFEYESMRKQASETELLKAARARRLLPFCDMNAET
jgi:hypothetical protein